MEPSLFYVLNLLLHPLLGLIGAALFARWLWRRRGVAGIGASLALLAGSLVAGAVLPFLAAGSVRGALLLAHVLLFVAALAVVLWVHRPRGGETKSGWWPAAALVVLAVGVGTVGAFAQRGADEQPESFVNPEAPTSMAGEAMPAADGEAGPFAPSALATSSGERLPVAALPPASTCAGSGCHDAAVAEWEASPHRWAGRENPWYRAVADEFVAERGEAALAFCSGCHEPARLATGSDAAPPGVGCAVCHGIGEVESTIGQADFVLTPSALSDLAARGAWGDRLHRWSVRLDPAGHARAWSPSTLGGSLASETCASCHKMHYDEPVNGHRWVQTMNDYDAWQASHISGYGGRSFYRPEAQSCAGCHMPPVAGGGEGGDEGDDARPSHRFAASNLGVAMLSGDDAQVAAVEEFGAGAVTVDLLAAVLGEAAATTTMAPLAGAAVPAGTSLRLDVVVATPGAGHYWPGGKLDLSDSWIELVGRDADGEVLFSSGATGDGPVDRAAHRFGLRMIDGDLQPLTHGETWDARSEIFRRWVLPLGADVVHYRLTVPAELAPGGSSASELQLTARLMSRQPSGDLDAWVREQAPEGSDALPEPPPPLVRGEATASLEVLAAGAEPRPGAAPTG
ncbi:MAG TPA: multiheme c-type cytochrome, partial [Thermoanaerobaculia bacterium]|nr:multiheme c-type cytochrome [Thermoanaerobaculia bacterium]